MIWATLAKAVLERSTSHASRIHGEAHWKAVAAAALCLIDNVPGAGADAEVALLFALFHDAMRENDGRDRRHGERGAELARELRAAGAFELDDERMALLVEAIADHEKGRTHADPTVGLCWDADRLNLWRVGRRPNPALLSTAAAQELRGFRRSALFHGLAWSWESMFLNFQARVGRRPLVYLRFGEPPESGRSAVPVLSCVGYFETGVSAYPASELDNGGYLLDQRRLGRGVVGYTLVSLLCQGRPLYAVRGRQVGWGGIGEPVLADVEIIEELPPDVPLVVEPYHPPRHIRRWRQLRKEAVSA